MTITSIGYKLQKGRNYIYFVHYSVSSSKSNAHHTEGIE